MDSQGGLGVLARLLLVHTLTSIFSVLLLYCTAIRILCAVSMSLMCAVGTLVSKTMLSAANAPYAAPAPGGTLVSLDVFSLQVCSFTTGTGSAKPHTCV